MVFGKVLGKESMELVRKIEALGSEARKRLKIDSGVQVVEDFVDQVVPLLQKKGIYRTEYAGTTLRENLGLDMP